MAEPESENVEMAPPPPINRRKDLGWKYCTQIRPPKNTNDLRCSFCAKELHGGIRRVKEHLAGGYPNVMQCRKCPETVQKEIKEYMSSKVTNRYVSSSGSCNDPFDLDSGDIQVPTSTTEEEINARGKYNSILEERHNTRDQIEPISLTELIESSNEWLLGIVEDDGVGVDCIVDDDDDYELQWGVDGEIVVIVREGSHTRLRSHDTTTPSASASTPFVAPTPTVPSAPSRVSLRATATTTTSTVLARASSSRIDITYRSRRHGKQTAALEDIDEERVPEVLEEALHSEDDDGDEEEEPEYHPHDDDF